MLLDQTLAIIKVKRVRLLVMQMTGVIHIHKDKIILFSLEYVDSASILLDVPKAFVPQT